MLETEWAGARRRKTSVDRLITETRLSEVARKLREPRLSISAIQETCGFRNANALQNLFKWRYNTSMPYCRRTGRPCREAALPRRDRPRPRCAISRRARRREPACPDEAGGRRRSPASRDVSCTRATSRRQSTRTTSPSTADAGSLRPDAHGMSSPAPPADMRAVTATTWSTLGDARSKRGLCSTGSAPVESYTTPFAVFVTAESWYGRHFASSSPPCHCITASPPAKTANEKDADAARHAAIRASARPVLP